MLAHGVPTAHVLRASLEATHVPDKTQHTVNEQSLSGCDWQAPFTFNTGQRRHSAATINSRATQYACLRPANS
eukprot:6463202-Amphidinium_carterae.1